MTNIFTDIRQLVLAAIGDLMAQGALPPGLDLARVAVEPPRDPAHGDLATNAAMVLASAIPASTFGHSPLGSLPFGVPARNPMALAEQIGAAMAARELVSGDYRGPGFTVAAARPGFLNITLMPEVWHAQLRAILRGRHRFRRFGGRRRRAGQCRIRLGQPDRADACRPRPRRGGRRCARGTAGQGRIPVEREYYVNDAGAQVDVLARSLHLRYREALGEAIGPIPDGFYPGEYLIETGRALAARDGRKWLDRPRGRVARSRCAISPSRR